MTPTEIQKAAEDFAENKIMAALLAFKNAKSSLWRDVTDKDVGEFAFLAGANHVLARVKELEAQLAKAEAVFNSIKTDVAYSAHAQKQYLEAGAEKQGVIKVNTPMRAIGFKIEEYFNKKVL